MIERQFVSENIKEFQIQEYVIGTLKRAGLSQVKMQKTPLGEKIVVYASRPGIIVGRKGQSIKKLTRTLKTRFNLENPQIEISEVKEVWTDPQIIADTIANSIERYGISKFKAVGHKAMSSAMQANALGIEIIMSGKIPSARAKRWRFYQGYLKKSGDVAKTQVAKAYAAVQLKTGTVGIQVRVMRGDAQLPDNIKLRAKAEKAGEAPVEKVAEKSGDGKDQRDQAKQ